MVNTSEQKYINGEFVPIRTGLVSCFNIETEKVEVVTPDAFLKSLYLVASTARKVRIDIYDEQGNLQFETYRNFKKTCKLNNLPYQSLIKSYKNNGAPIYSNVKSLSAAKRAGFEKYAGWYAIKKD